VTLRFNIGDIVNVDGEEYHIVGRIKYRNSSDGMCWDEYRMIPLAGYTEAWLSVDDEYKEYSISRRSSLSISTAGYHLVDSGTETVVSREGKVDVDIGDRANFYEYEDSTEEKIISREIWDDETEVCTGYYLDEDEISFVRHDTQYHVRSSDSSTLKPGSLIIAIGILLVILLPDILSGINLTPSIKKYLNKSQKYTYVTSITGNEREKAKVYKAEWGYSIGDTAKDIIDAVEGKTVKVQQDTEVNEEDASIGILTGKEYCLIYRSEDGEVLIQVSDRKYAYSTDSQPYHSSHHVHSYYKRFYYSSGYSHDRYEYESSSSPYSSYDGDTMEFSSDDTYSSYSSSVRQSSVYSRSSSGGGLSSGK